jgi:hypothetical protein
MITKVFKGLSDRYGTFAYMEGDKFILGETVINKTNYLYRGSLEAFRQSRQFIELAARNRPLVDDIINYYKYSYKKEKNQENTDMDNTEKLISRLHEHYHNWGTGKTQDFEQVAKDCLAAADKLYMYSNSEITSAITAGVQKESRPTKLCEIKVDRKDSLQELTYHLTANGYTVQTAVVWKEYPQSGIDYWMIAIFDKEENK